MLLLQPSEQSTILERIVYEKVYAFLRSSSFLNLAQTEFWECHFNTTWLLDFLDGIYKEKEHCIPKSEHNTAFAKLFMDFHLTTISIQYYWKSYEIISTSFQQEVPDKDVLFWRTGENHHFHIRCVVWLACTGVAYDWFVSFIIHSYDDVMMDYISQCVLGQLMTFYCADLLCA